MLIEEKILAHLLPKNVAGLGNNINMEVPTDPPMRYVTIEKTGGGGGPVEEAIFAIQSRSRVSLVDAATINNEVKKALADFRDTTENVFSCRLNSDYNFTNTTTKEYRYQAVYTITYQEDID